MRDKIEAICDALGSAMQEPAREGHAEIFLHELEHDGFFVVPREPTTAMNEAGQRYVNRVSPNGSDSCLGQRFFYSELFTAMIDAAKEPPK